MGSESLQQSRVHTHTRAHYPIGTRYCATPRPLGGFACIVQQPCVHCSVPTCECVCMCVCMWRWWNVQKKTGLKTQKVRKVEVPGARCWYDKMRSRNSSEQPKYQFARLYPIQFRTGLHIVRRYVCSAVIATCVVRTNSWIVKKVRELV